MSSEYFHFTTKRRHTKSQGQQIQDAVKAIDEKMEWIGPIKIPGNDNTGWLSRPDDGTNEQNPVRARVELAKKAINKILA